MKISCSSYYLSKKLTSVSLSHKNFKKHLLIKVNIKYFSKYVCRQLKLHQHKIRSKLGILLEITPNVFKCLIVSLVLLRFLLQQHHHFCLFYFICEFAMVPGVYILLSRHEEEVHSFFLRAKMYTFSSTFIKTF